MAGGGTAMQAPTDFEARPWVATEGLASLPLGQWSGPTRLGMGKHERY